MRWLLRVEDRAHDPLPWWLRVAYPEFNRPVNVVAPVGLHLLARHTRLWKHWVFKPLMRAHLWHLGPDAYFLRGSLVWPWSKCWAEDEARQKQSEIDCAEKLRLLHEREEAQLAEERRMVELMSSPHQGD